MDEQSDSASNAELKRESVISPDRPTHVRVLLYCFKPPFPSDGGSAAASAGRWGPSTFTDVNPVRVIGFDKGDSKAHVGRP